MRPDDAARPHDERRFEAIDACRPGSQDHDLPETRFLTELFERDHAHRVMFERVQQFDQSIQAALERGPVPGGLEQRLLAALAAAREASVDPVQGAIDSPAPTAENTAAPGTVGEPRRRTSRRVWMASAAATAAALLVAYWFWPANEYTHEGVLAFGQAFFTADQGRGSGISPAAKKPPTGYRLSRFVNPHAGQQWRYVKGFLGRNGVAYDLELGGVTATLYVVKVAGTPKSPRILPGAGQSPLRQPASSGQRPTDAWLENGYLYVLVVEGSEADYQQFITSGGAVA
ncbi:MAG: hypothetical protein KF708_04300 [Pirellulales bacterium]|nr:hypothetical protein [Pirellulales bacterium]